jgi:GAF domain-containing protein
MTQGRDRAPAADAARSSGGTDPAEALQHCVDAAESLIEACDAAAVTLVRRRRARVAASTSDLARELDWSQHRAGEGPSIDAVRQLQVFNVDSIPDAPSWPSYRRVASEKGIRSSLSVPLTVRAEALGVLNLYSRQSNAFRDCEVVAMALAARTAVALGKSHRRTVLLPG